MFSFCFSLFGTFVFETSCILVVSLVCFVLLVFLGSIFVMFCMYVLDFFLFLGLVFLRLRAF